ncbi:MAG: hypothetical protein WC969_10795 [Elusimicrobiota bacterium]|jgi:hypothetical protein
MIRIFLLAFMLPVCARAEAPATLNGVVVKVENGAVYLDLGEASGVKTGSTFAVLGLGEELKHPVSGASLGRVETEKGLGLVSEVHEKYALGKLGSGTAAPGDPVRVRPNAQPAAPAPAQAAAPQAAVRPPLWKSPQFPLEAVDVAAADVDGDGKAEAVLADKDSVTAYSLEDWHAVCSFKDKATAVTNLSVEAMDLDKDGKAEVFLTLNNRFFDRVESYVLDCSSGPMNKRATLEWMVRSYEDETGTAHLASQGLLKDAAFPYGPIKPLVYENGRYQQGPGLKLPRLEWLYGFATPKAIDETFPAFYTVNNRIRLQFGKRSWFTPETYGQTANRVRRRESNFQFHPRLLVAPGGTEGFAGLYTLRNVPRFGALSDAFGSYNAAELLFLRWTGANVEPDWKIQLPGYAPGLATRVAPDGRKELLAAVVGANGKTTLWSFPK